MLVGMRVVAVRRSGGRRVRLVVVIVPGPYVAGVVVVVRGGRREVQVPVIAAAVMVNLDRDPRRDDACEQEHAENGSPEGASPGPARDDGSHLRARTRSFRGGPAERPCGELPARGETRGNTAAARPPRDRCRAWSACEICH